MDTLQTCGSDIGVVKRKGWGSGIRGQAGWPNKAQSHSRERLGLQMGVMVSNDVWSLKLRVGGASHVSISP